MIVAAAILCACAAPAKRPLPEAWSEYKIAGSIGLVVNTSGTWVRAGVPDNKGALSLESAAEAKRKEASMGAGATALTILTAPLAIFAPLYPPAIQLAALPAMAVDATAKASQDAERLQQEAARARLDAACGEQLAATHPELPQKLEQALPGESLVQAIQDEVRSALQARARVPVITLRPQRYDYDGSLRRDAVLKEAEDLKLPTLFVIEIQSLELRGEATGDKRGDCRYMATTATSLTWWKVENGAKVYQADALARNSRLPGDSMDLLMLLERPEELRLQLARAFRDAVLGTVNVPTLKFLDSPP